MNRHWSNLLQYAGFWIKRMMIVKDGFLATLVERGLFRLCEHNVNISYSNSNHFKCPEFTCIDS